VAASGDQSPTMVVSVVWAVLLDDDGPSGGLFRDGDRLTPVSAFSAALHTQVSRRSSR
jgi:hypothetical protein